MLTMLPGEWVSSYVVNAILVSRFERMNGVGVIISEGLDIRVRIEKGDRIVGRFGEAEKARRFKASAAQGRYQLHCPPTLQQQALDWRNNEKRTV